MIFTLDNIERELAWIKGELEKIERLKKNSTPYNNTLHSEKN